MKDLSTVDIIIENYKEDHRGEVLSGIIDIQEIEKSYSETRRSGFEMIEEYSEDIFKEVKENKGAIFAAKYGDKVVGFIICFIKRDKDPIQTTESNIYGYISDVWVHIDWRGQGIFPLLNKKVEQHFKQFSEIHYLRMSVLAKNKRAIDAYLYTGYEAELITVSKKI